MNQSPLKELFYQRRLLRQMSARDFKSKYARSLMGVFWTLINPLLLLLVFTFIGVSVLKVRFGGRPELEVNALYILCGILPWLAFQDGIARSGTVVLENKNLVTRALFPLSVLPAYPAISSLFGQLAGLVILGVAASIILAPPGPSLVILPLILVLQLVFTIGLAMAVASISVYLRDVIHVLPVLLLVWMFGTPIFYRVERLPEHFQMLILLNPVAAMVGAYRRVLLEGAWPQWSGMIVIAAWAALALLAGTFIFKRLCPGFADRL